MNKKCPYCGNGNISTERRLDEFHHCIDCHYSWRVGSSTPVIPLQKNIEPFKQFSLLKHVDMVVGINKTGKE